MVRTITDDPGGTADRRMAWLLARADVARRMVGQRGALGAADRRLLWLLVDGRARTLREVSSDLGLEQSTVNRQVNAALADGLLRRYRDGGGGAYLLEPTPAGRAAFESDVSSTLAAYAAGLGALEPDEVDRLLVLLERFVDAYAAAAHDPGPATAR